MNRIKLNYLLGCITFFIFVIFIIYFINNPNPYIDYKYDNVEDTYYVYKAHGNIDEIDIKEEINNKKVTKVATRAFYQSNVKKINLPASIKTIDRLAFSECHNLEYINLDDVVDINVSAFMYCDKLNNLNIGAKHIGASAFYGCSSLNNIKLSNNLSTISTYSFSKTAIEIINIPKNTYNVYFNAFVDMPNLKTIYIHSLTLKNNEYLKTLPEVVYEEL